MAAIETLGEAYSAKWGVRMRCARYDHRGITRIDPSGFEADLNMQTLVATRGRRFPLARLASRLVCPNCGETRIQLPSGVPGSAILHFVPQSPWRRTG